MKLYDDDIRMALDYQKTHLTDFPKLEPSQIKAIRSKADELHKSFRSHPLLHNIAGVFILVALFVLDWKILLSLPHWVPFSTLSDQIGAGLLGGLVHGFIICSVVTYSLHEGAAHGLIILGHSRISRWLQFLTSNACRLFLADPIHYSQSHFAHHKHLGSALDQSYTQMVQPKRLLVSLIPMQPFFNFSDFRPWLPDHYSKSRLVSIVLTLIYTLVLFVATAEQGGVIYAKISIFMIGAWLGVALDRIREASEHVLMPSDNHNGTRDLGLGFWGLFLGGGPWGQPCHLSHHLAPQLPWYMQIRLHFFLRSILTDSQKEHFLLKPVLGFPQLMLRSIATYLNMRTRENHESA